MNKLCVCLTLVVCLAVSSLALAQTSFTDYNDVQQVLAFLTDILPPELKSSDLSARRKAWPDWVVAHDRDIRRRLLRGDEDTIVNWLLFGTSFTRQPRAFFEVPATPESLPQRISKRTRRFDFGARSADRDERTVFARRLLLGQGYGFDTVEEQARLERHLYAEVERVVAERQQYMLQGGCVPGRRCHRANHGAIHAVSRPGPVSRHVHTGQFCDRTSAGDDEEPRAASAKPHSTRGGDRAGTRFCGQELGL